MTRLPIAARTLRELRWMVIWFGSGLALYGGGMIVLYPFFDSYLSEVAATYPEGVLQFFGGGDLATPQGFVTVEYQSFAVLAMMIFAVVAATGQLAGEEGRGTLEGILAQPVTRTRVFLEKGLGVLGAALLVCAINAAGWLATAPFVDLHGELSLLDLAGATLGALPVVFVFAALGFMVGAIAPSRSTAAGLVAAFAVLSYLAASLGGAIAPVSWIRYFSLYYYSDASRWLISGPDPRHQGAMVAAGVLLSAGAAIAFNRREIGAHTWQLSSAWRRRRPVLVRQARGS